MKLIQENITKDSVDLSGFTPKDTLNPRLWDENLHLDSAARKALLQIAYDFMESAELDIFSDIIMTGSLANYNWNDEYSDVDLHIVSDFKMVSDDPVIAKAYFDEKRSNWNSNHTGITIFGYPVEIYVQDCKEPHKSTGVYSLMKDTWLTKPSLDKLPDTSNKDQIVDGVTAYCNMIDTLIGSFELCANDKESVNEILIIADKLYEAIRQERKDSMAAAKYTELTTGNLIFKSLRRNGYMKKLIDLRRSCFDKLHSI